MKTTRNATETQCCHCGRTIEAGAPSIVVAETFQENGMLVGAGDWHSKCGRQVARLIRKADR